MKTCVLWFFSICLHNAYCLNFAEHFKVCHRNDAKLDKCLVDAIENGLKTLGSTGLPAINFPAIDPLKITKITIGAGTSAVKLVQNYHNVKLIGLSNLKVENAHLDFGKNTLSFTTSHPVLKQEAEYDINGNILILPVFGKGDSAISLLNTKWKHVISFTEEKKTGKRYFKISNYTLSITNKKVHFDFKNLFNGDKLLGDNILKVVNDNWDVLFQDVKGGVEDSYAKSFLGLAQILFGKIAVDEILPN